MNEFRIKDDVLLVHKRFSIPEDTGQPAVESIFYIHGEIIKSEYPENEKLLVLYVNPNTGKFETKVFTPEQLIPVQE